MQKAHPTAHGATKKASHSLPLFAVHLLARLALQRANNVQGQYTIQASTSEKCYGSARSFTWLSDVEEKVMRKVEREPCNGITSKFRTLGIPFREKPAAWKVSSVLTCNYESERALHSSSLSLSLSLALTRVRACYGEYTPSTSARRKTREGQPYFARAPV